MTCNHDNLFYMGLLTHALSIQHELSWPLRFLVSARQAVPCLLIEAGPLASSLCGSLYDVKK
jgi:hypothetical protein